MENIASSTTESCVPSSGETVSIQQQQRMTDQREAVAQRRHHQQRSSRSPGGGPRARQQSAHPQQRRQQKPTTASMSHGQQQKRQRPAGPPRVASERRRPAHHSGVRRSRDDNAGQGHEGRSGGSEIAGKKMAASPENPARDVFPPSMVHGDRGGTDQRGAVGAHRGRKDPTKSSARHAPEVVAAHDLPRPGPSWEATDEGHFFKKKTAAVGGRGGSFPSGLEAPSHHCGRGPPPPPQFVRTSQGGPRQKKGGRSPPKEEPRMEVPSYASRDAGPPCPPQFVRNEGGPGQETKRGFPRGPLWNEGGGLAKGRGLEHFPPAEPEASYPLAWDGADGTVGKGGGGQSGLYSKKVGMAPPNASSPHDGTVTGNNWDRGPRGNSIEPNETFESEPRGDAERSTVANASDAPGHLPIASTPASGARDHPPSPDRCGERGEAVSAVAYAVEEPEIVPAEPLVPEIRYVDRPVPTPAPPTPTRQEMRYGDRPEPTAPPREFPKQQGQEARPFPTSPPPWPGYPAQSPQQQRSHRSRIVPQGIAHDTGRGIYNQPPAAADGESNCGGGDCCACSWKWKVVAIVAVVLIVAIAIGLGATGRFSSRL